MRRRDFIRLAGGAAAAWPYAAFAQQPERMRRIGVLMNSVADDPEVPSRIATLALGLQSAGWTIGQNVRIEYRWAGGDPQRYRAYAAELAALRPDIFLAAGAPAVAAVQQAAGNTPIVFVQVTDPVAAGLVESLARPGGSATGFTNFEYGLSPKWLELLKQIAPAVTRVAVIRDASTTTGIGLLGAIQGVAPSFGVELVPIGLRGGAEEIERGLAASSRSPNSGLLALTSASVAAHRDLIVALAARYRLPAVYYDRSFTTAGGLVSYGADRIDQYRLAAGYLSRILKGEKPSDLPVQQPTKFDLVINLRTAKALGLEIPPKLLALANEVIE